MDQSQSESREGGIDVDIGGAHKSIAIIGGGSAGLGMLKAALDLPESIREDWEVVLYERRRDIGGIWLPDPPGSLPSPPDLPETPLYPRLWTNIPHPIMTYPHFLFRPHTTLYPSWHAVFDYHADYARDFNLTSFIRLNHSVESAQWNGSRFGGNWNVQIRAKVDGVERLLQRTHTHIVVAIGSNHYPYIPEWNGTEQWLSNTPLGFPQRELSHSIYYRDPFKYTDRKIIIVGSGPSAFDIARQVDPVAAMIYQSIKPGKDITPGTRAIPMKPISHFTPNSIVFEDGIELTDIDAVIMATGYELRVPFLSAPHSSALVDDPHASDNSSTAQKLITNRRYIFPLYRHIFNLAPEMPPTALSFIGIPKLAASCITDYAQGLFVAHTIANSSLLPDRRDMLTELLARENSLRLRGYDPYLMGHSLVDGTCEPHEYPDALIDHLKRHGLIPKDHRRYVDNWRRLSSNDALSIKRGWTRIEEHGDEARWLRGVHTEEEWGSLLLRILEWQREWEVEHDPMDSNDNTIGPRLPTCA
ncbi:dimethylaniline monooxygenase [Wolfiporia cocos MD-104 SS10]|uniref:Dimethylaniline monooxygenase n=1 Tax=Wolfiporia cocos (strain MD-104) TaxID=742152 RepID=A0A2H3JPX6_WOLCO|nr:dimethylaniline monooxygenase [Wolfiporia cocos MD-104 SS10]